METESVRSDLSARSRRSRGHRDRQHSHHSRRSDKVQRNGDPDDSMAPFQTSVSVNPDGGRDGQEVIEVQILPQDDNWGENTTAITGNTSDNSQSLEDLAPWPTEDDRHGAAWSRRLPAAFALTLCVAAFLSPIAMLAIPRLRADPIDSVHEEALRACGAECRGALAALACRLAALAAGAWALLLRPAAARLPRAPLARVALLLLLALCTFAHWLFYLAAVEEEGAEYRSAVAAASALADTLLALLLAAALAGEVRALRPAYCVKVTRSPDGASRSFCLGRLSVQGAAVALLAEYYAAFPAYNPYLEKIPLSKSQRKRRSGSFKFYDVDGANGTSTRSGQSRAVLTASARRRDSAHNERFYEEHEYERRVRKRRARLLTAAEEAFAHVKRVRGAGAGTGVGGRALEAGEAAAAVFPSLARALQKYLRVTRQQPRHSAESILAHLARCLARDLSPRAFLEPFVGGGGGGALPPGRGPQAWALESAAAPTAPLRDGRLFQLRQGDVRLLCSVRELPLLSISEELPDPSTERFVLRLNSETSV